MELYVSPEGRDGADGSLEHPLRLENALSDESPVRPGDVVWLRGGTYRGSFQSAVSGSESSPITFRQFPGERAIIDYALTILGSWTTFRDLELTTSTPQRRTAQPGPWPDDIRSGGINAHGAHTQLINLVIHDLSSGVGLWSESVGSVVYGSLIFQNGWQGPDRAHGHGVYTQNKDGVREIADNIIFGQYSHGIHAYGSSEAYLDNITIRGNVVFNNGVMVEGGEERDILLGGGRVAHNAVIEDNSTYGLAQSNVGYAAGCEGATISRNYFVGSSPLILESCQPAMTGNTFVGPMGRAAELYPDNHYFATAPTGHVAFVRPNRFDPTRFHIVAYNWDRLPQITIDAPAGLDDGVRYEIVDVQDYFGAPVLTATHKRGTPIVLPMVGLTKKPIPGDVPQQLAHTAPEFAAFVLRLLPKTATSTPHPQADRDVRPK